MGASPNTSQQTESLRLLNNIVLSTVGNEVSDPLDDMNIGGTYDETTWTSEFIPDRVRLVLNLSDAKTLKLDPQPYDGQRLSFVDIAGNLATYPLTLDGNGRKIEGVTSLVLNTNSDAREWMYRADLASWVKITSLLYTDALPFPQDFDDYFITMLAMRINPRYGQSLTPETTMALKRSRSQLRARYHACKEVRPDLNTRGFMSDPYSYDGLSPNNFSTGRIYPWR